MVTTAPANLLWLAKEWEKAISTAVFAGIVADNLHVAPSKHKSFNDNPAGSWPREHAKDKKGPRTRSCAIDMRMALKDMILVHTRYRAVFNDITDSRRKYVYAFNGWDGQGSPGRYNVVTMTVSITDRSHEWHEHAELYYLYVGDDAESWKAARAHLSIVRGWSDAQWQASETEDTVSTADVVNGLAEPDEWQSAGVRNLAKSRGWGDKVSTRALIEYLFMEISLRGEENRAKLLEELRKINQETDNDVQLSPEQMELIAQRLAALAPTPADVAKAVNEDASARLAT